MLRRGLEKLKTFRTEREMCLRTAWAECGIWLRAEKTTLKYILKYVLLTWYSLGEVKAVLREIYAVQMAVVSLICCSRSILVKTFGGGTKNDVGFSGSVTVGNG